MGLQMKCLQKFIGKEITAKYKLNTHHCKEQLKTFSHPTPYASSCSICCPTLITTISDMMPNTL